jgi:hypothetical protein
LAISAGKYTRSRQFFSYGNTGTDTYGRTASYVENVITEAELAATQPRIQERIKQVAARNAAGLGGGGQWNGFYSSPAPTPLNRLKRVGVYIIDALLSPIDCSATDWLCEAHFLDQFIRDERYAEQRLGFNAPNILVMKLETYAN